jgi:hypothetical protein
LGGSSATDYRPATRVKGYDKPPKYHTSDDSRYRSRGSESGEFYADRHMKKEVSERKRRIFSNQDSNGRRLHGCDGKLQKTVHGKPRTESSVHKPVTGLICKNSKNSEEVMRDTRREKHPSLQDNDLATCSGTKMNVTGSADTSRTSDSGKQTLSLTVKETDRTQETSGTKRDSDGDSCGKSVSCSQCLTGTSSNNSAEGTESSECRKLNIVTKSGESEVGKVHMSEDDSDCALGHEKANFPSVSHFQSGYRKGNASITSCPSSGDKVGSSKTKVMGVGKTEDQTLAESKPTEKSQILGELATAGALWY